MKRVRCKFRCVTASPGPAPYTATFEPVYSGSPESDQFFAATPSGSLSLGIVAEQHFEPGKEYYLDITPAEPTWDRPPGPPNPPKGERPTEVA